MFQCSAACCRMDNVLRRSWTYLFLLIICAKFNHIWALEEPRQEIYLQPRNYNPHPYQVDVQASNHITPNRGPILFPPSPAPDVDNERSNFIRVENDRNVAPHPVDNHPYPKVARKYRFRNPGRHQEYENQINPQVSNALAKYAKKVLRRPASDYIDDSFSNEQKNYAFSYKVVDHLTGDDFSHTQSQNEKATRGEYRVKLPDGRVQIVSYTADKNGYKADVKYQDDLEKPQQKVIPQQTHDYKNQIESYTNTEYESGANGGYVYDHKGNREGIEFGVKATPAVAIQGNGIDEYDHGRRIKQRIYTPVATQSPRLVYAVTQPSFNDYHAASLSHHNRALPLPNLDYRNAIHHQHQHPHPQHRFSIIPQDKVEIVNQGVAPVGSTVAPAYLENPQIILSSTASPPLSFSGDYHHVFVTSIPDLYSRNK